MASIFGALVGLIIGCAPLLLLYEVKSKIKYLFLAYVFSFSVWLSLSPNELSVSLNIVVITNILFSIYTLILQKKHRLLLSETYLALIAINGWGAIYLGAAGGLNTIFHIFWQTRQIHDVGGVWISMMSLIIFMIVAPIMMVIAEKIDRHHK